MPDIGLLELVLIGAVAFLVLGPERLPEFFAQIGRMVRRARGWAGDMKRQISAETESLQEPMKEVRDALDGGLSTVPDDGKPDERKAD